MGPAISSRGGAATVARAKDEIMKQTDTQLQQAVSRELDWDTRLNGTEIAVGARAGSSEGCGIARTLR